MPDNDFILARVDPARRMLAECRDANGAKRIADKARALEIYATRQKLGRDCVDYAHALVIDSLADMGAFLKNQPKNTGAKGIGKSAIPNGHRTPTLKEQGISLKESAAGQILASIRAKNFKDYAQVRDNKASVSKIMRERRRRAVLHRLENIETKTPSEPSGLYDVIVIDPPWPMSQIERECRPNQSRLLQYPTMAIEEIKAIEIPCAADAHLWLWTTNRFLPDALDILKTWGFEYLCCFVWHKPGGFQPFNLPQYNCEFALYARKGKPVFADIKDFSLCFNGQRQGHSAKPDEFYDVVSRVTSGRRIDMFSRRKIQGFDGWGKEAK